MLVELDTTNVDGKKYVVWRGGIYCMARRNIVRNSSRRKTAEEVMWGIQAVELPGLGFRIHAKESTMLFSQELARYLLHVGSWCYHSHSVSLLCHII